MFEKRSYLIIIVALLSVMYVCGATAVTSDTAGTLHMPVAVREILEQKWSGCEITGWVNPASEKVSSVCGFATIRHKGTNRLVAFGYKDNQWFYQWKSDDVGTQQNGITLALYDRSSETAAPAFIIREQGPGNCPVATVWVKDRKKGTYLLTEVNTFDTDGETLLETQQVKDGKVTYKGWLTEGKTVTCNGTVQRDIRYFSYQAFPKNPEAMKKKLTVAPSVPQSEQLQAKEIKFTGGKRYNVYTGPDQKSLRGGKGKATVSTNGWIQVFGMEGDWILIQYSIDNQHYRFGYISAKALPKKNEIHSLQFSHIPVQTQYAVIVTDDPLFSGAALISLPAGEKATLLADLGDWAYIEFNGHPYGRGFVPTDSIAVIDGDEQNFAVYTSKNGTHYDLFSIQKFHYDSRNQVIAVSGVYERKVRMGDGEGPETAKESQITYVLAENFKADMIKDINVYPTENEVIVDLHEWYTTAYCAPDFYQGGELIFCVDDPERDDCNFWSITTKIELNKDGQIEYMEYVRVPWE